MTVSKANSGYTTADVQSVLLVLEHITADVDAIAWWPSRWSCDQTSATLQPDMSWGDWRHECGCNTRAALDVMIKRYGLLGGHNCGDTSLEIAEKYYPLSFVNAGISLTQLLTMSRGSSFYPDTVYKWKSGEISFSCCIYNAHFAYKQVVIFKCWLIVLFWDLHFFSQFRKDNSSTYYTRGFDLLE